MKPACLAMACVWLASAAPIRADGDARAIAFNCVSCHQVSSELTETEIPSLSDLSEQQIKQMLLDFKYDKKQATLMPRLAKGYSDEELAAVAAYLSRH